ncbi:unnamed protein product [Owenia fusiformis]|uniref:Uncharacterized protein n=1 Tax=Owenia fusiformis TaxID=6347 RepID=A0A8J1UNK3_OWEFU|nr:unnamed protein product [Owenia fusiformis]
MDPITRKRLRANYVVLVRNLTADHVLDRLYQEAVVTEEDCEDIRAEVTRAQGVRHLLSVLQRKSNPKTFEIFCDSLREATYDFLADLLINIDPDDVASSPEEETDTLTELKSQLKEQNVIVRLTKLEMEKAKLQIADLRKSMQDLMDSKEKISHYERLIAELESEREKQDEKMSNLVETIEQNLDHYKEIMGSNEALNDPDIKYKVKCVVIGDGESGKTSMCMTYGKKQFPKQDYVPTVFDHYIMNFIFKKQNAVLEVWETAGQDDYDRLRTLTYPNTDVGIICFSVTNRKSAQNVIDKWVPEFKKYLPNVPYIIIGTKTDLRKNVDKVKEIEESGGDIMTWENGEEIADKAGAQQYLECSSQLLDGLEEVFYTGLIMGLKYRKDQRKKNKNQKQCSMS